ncbi:MAG TPA: hypothetical protein VFX70_13515 [Mycobacteriales bacterium]|nr:hypothetical protein [Mycobacteriales bacterium]
MKLADPDNPVRYTWLAEQGFRLDPGPYVSDAYRMYKLLEALPRTSTLAQVSERIFRPGIFRRHWTTDRAHGVRFLGSASIFQSDLSTLPMITRRSFDETPDLPLKPGWTLITCSGMTAGRVTYARPDMDGCACSQDVIRVVPDQAKIPGGYLYALLASRYGRPIIRGRVYGTSIKHLEPEHLANIPVPRVGPAIEDKIDALIGRAAELRARFQAGVVAATWDVFTSAGLPELADLAWHDQPRDLGFAVPGVDARTLRALNFSPRARRILDALRSVPHRTLGDICAGGILRTGARFKRIDADPVHGVRLVGQRQAFWMRPEGRWINPHHAPPDILQSDETILIAAHGTLGENEVYGRSILVTGGWLRHAFSQDFVRVRTGTPEFTGAYLFGFLRSEAAFRVLRSMSVGGKQQEYHPGLLRDLPVPLCTAGDRERIAGTVRRAYRDRDDADAAEDEALALLDAAVREAAG